MKKMMKTVLETAGYSVRRIQPPLPEPPVSDSVRALLRRLWPVAIDVPLVRVGGRTDGAYLVPDDMEGIEALFSPGVDRVAQFELEIAERGIPCFLADASVEEPPAWHDAFHFERRFLGLRNSGRMSTIDAWVERHAPGGRDLLLQMDIEGAEWTVLPNMSDELLRRFRIMVVEFHALRQLLADEYVAVHIIETLERLLETHYVVHNHPNNYGQTMTRGDVEIPNVTEITFLRKDRAIPRDYARAFPHLLDIRNGSHLADLPLPTAWFAPSEVRYE